MRHRGNLGLAVDILPVAADGSTDETSNGVALCSLHHDAMDNSLVSFNAGYRIELSARALVELGNRKLLGGHKEFQAGLKPAILLPADKRDYPNKRFIERGREARSWQA